MNVMISCGLLERTLSGGERDGVPDCFNACWRGGGQSDYLLPLVADYDILVRQLAVSRMTWLFEVDVKRISLFVISDPHIACRSLFNHGHELQVVFYFS